MKTKLSVRQERKGGRLRKGATHKKSQKENIGRSGRRETPLPPPQSEYIRIFDRLFRSFRSQVFEYYGDRCDEVIARAEKKISLLSPEYDRHSLTDDTAPLVLDVVGEIVNAASLFKRPKLRRAAVALISDLYNKHYGLLEQGNILDRVEQAYYRLKK